MITAKKITKNKSVFSSLQRLNIYTEPSFKRLNSVFMPKTLLTNSKFNKKIYRMEEIKTGIVSVFFFVLVYFVPCCLHLNDKFPSILKEDLAERKAFPIQSRKYFLFMK